MLHVQIIILYLHTLQYNVIIMVQVLFLCPKIKWSRVYYYCPVCLLSTSTFTITLNLWERLHTCIWHTYSANDAFSIDTYLWPCDLLSEQGRMSQEFVPGANVIAPASASAFNLAVWTKTVTLAITFKPLKIKLSYFICVFLMTGPFTWYLNFWPCDLHLEVWHIFEILQPWI